MTTTNSSPEPRRGNMRNAALAALGASATLLAVGLLASADPPDTNPSTAPIPDLPVETDAKALIATVAFTSQTDATAISSEVRYGAAHSRLGDPPLLRVKILSDNGSVLDEYNSWHPLWAFVEDSSGEESRIILDEAEGSFIVPFDRDATSMVIVDVPLNEEVVEVDLTEAIGEFCVDNPTDSSCRVADLAVSRVAVTAQPTLSLIGATGSITVETDVTNLGPTEPMDATATHVATSDPGITVTPVSGETTHDLDVGEVDTVSREYDMTCDEPGLKDVTFTSSIAPTHPADIDLQSHNDSAGTTVTIDCVVPVTINIQPGGSPNTVNVTARRGSIPVAVLTTAEGEYGNPVAFDAGTVDAASARFGAASTILAGDGATPRNGRGHLEDALELDDVTEDGDVDMVIQFVGPGDTGLTTADTEACLAGEYTSGSETYRFWGCDAVRPI